MVRFGSKLSIEQLYTRQREKNRRFCRTPRFLSCLYILRSLFGDGAALMGERSWCRVFVAQTLVCATIIGAPSNKALRVA